ncbi:MAG: aminotransferase class III-fold pyridoxal phosphate-dependent enzyme [Acidobacteria bacterium]|nr:aminotransferase class III-fold pyridoxal phosphate-dependent enzyme [Acidobacteriota bacterium]
MTFNTTEIEARVRAKTPGSGAAYERSQRSLAGGVSTALRRSAKPYPLFFAGGSGPCLTDIDGNRYIDYTLAWGPLILGHAPQPVNDAIGRQLPLGHTFGAQHELEYRTAELLCQAIPCADRVAFANSGTEIVQVALRLARAYTRRPLYLKFEGHYHGWDDSVLVSYKPSLEQSGVMEPVPVGQGQRPWSGAVVARWNNRESVQAAFAAYPEQISAIICEPLLCNSGCLPPDPGFLSFLRQTADEHGALLVFDEVITGFRLALGGAQEFYGVTPDLATFAKAAAAGLPVSILAGKEFVMEWIADGRVVHAGTLNGNPVSLAATEAALRELAASDFPALHVRGRRLRDGLVDALRAKGVDAVATGEGTCYQLHLQQAVPREYRDTIGANKALYADFLMALLDAGIYALPDGRWYISFAHGDGVVDDTLERVRAL